MSEVDLPDLVQEALKKLSEKELKKMEHCVGFDSRKVYHRKGFAYFKPYRNYFDPGGTDREIWAGIKKKGYAERVYIRQRQRSDRLLSHVEP